MRLYYYKLSHQKQEINILLNFDYYRVTVMYRKVFITEKNFIYYFTGYV